MRDSGQRNRPHLLNALDDRRLHQPVVQQQLAAAGGARSVVVFAWVGRGGKGAAISRGWHKRASASSRAGRAPL